MSMAMAASTYNIPIISNWATGARLTDRGLFPTFTRTIPSDGSGAFFAAQLVKQLGFKRCGLLHESSDFGSNFKEALFTEMSKLDINLKFSAYDSADAVTAKRAMRTMKESKYNVILVVSYMADLLPLADAFVEEGMEDRDILFIFLALDDIDSTLVRVTGSDIFPPSDNIAKLIHGSLYFSPSILPNPQWTNFQEKFINGDFEGYESAVSDMFQPNGLGDTHFHESCANADMSYPLTPGYLNGSRSEFITDIWAYTFDIVIAAGLAVCHATPTQPIPSALDSTFNQAVFEELLKVNFQGLSGPVSFKPNGDRDQASARYVLTNFKRGGFQSVTASSVGEWDHSTGTWSIEMASVQWRQGVGAASLPAETLLPVQDPNFLPIGLKIWGYIEVAFMNLLCIFSIAWLYKNRNNKIIINAQGSLLMVMCLGCLIASWSVLALTADDQITDMLDENVSCMVAPVLFSIGFQLALLALLGKVYRIFLLFKSSKKLRRHRVSTHHVLGGVALFMSAEMIILVCWIVLAPLRFERLVGSKDEFGNPMNSYGQCSGGPECVAFVVVVFALHAVAVVATGYASSRVRDLPVQYQESRYLNLAVLSMSQIYLISVPTVVATYSNVIGRFVITSTVVLVTVCALVLFLIVPKMMGEDFFSGGSSEQNSKHNSNNDIVGVGTSFKVNSPHHDHASVNTSTQVGHMSTSRVVSAPAT